MIFLLLTLPCVWYIKRINIFKGLPMKYLALLCIFVMTSVFAQTDIDQRLQGYIQTFNLKPLTPPSPINKKLFLLGREFFFEKKLSGNLNISCADCHHPMTMTVDGLPLSVGEGAMGIETTNGGRQQKNGKIIARNAPALFNLHNAPMMFWDGRLQLDPATGIFTTPAPMPVGFSPVLKNALAAQALFPMVNHDEMRGQKGSNQVADAADEEAAWKILFDRIISDPVYKQSLEDLFPGEELSMAHVARAIGHFEEEAFYAADTNYDRYLKGDLKAMTEIQKIGMEVFFNKGKCGECHRGEHLTDFSFHNVGTPQFGPGKVNGDDFGRMEQDPRPENLYAFRVPALRNASVTAPYMHDGAFKTLAQVIEHYDNVELSLNDYVFVNNYKNYFDSLGSVRSETNLNKIASLSTKLTRKLNFEESEEKAIAEFVRGALTERRFLDAEISSDYMTSLRIQLKEDGYNKILNNLPATAQEQDTTWFYFDVRTDEGYRLRELETPVKIFFTRSQTGTTLTYRKQLFKTSGSVSGVIAGGTFEDEEVLMVDQGTADSLAAYNNDFFTRLYSYNNATTSEEIPPMVKTPRAAQGIQMLIHGLRDSPSPFV
jgi:cytochrome c peroxidase